VEDTIAKYPNLLRFKLGAFLAVSTSVFTFLWTFFRHCCGSRGASCRPYEMLEGLSKSIADAKRKGVGRSVAAT
jgi:hypothetical protein